MSMVQRILYAIRTLTEDEPPQSSRRRHRNRTPPRNSSKHKQAVALVITFRDLFTSGGLNILLEDIENNHSNRKTRDRSSFGTNSSQNTPVSKNSLKNSSASGSLYKVEVPESVNKISPKGEQALIDLWSDIKEDTIPILHEERIIASSPEFQNFSTIGAVTSAMLPVVPETNALELYGRNARNKKNKQLMVSLSPEDENKTVDALRKVLKWSPRKQSLAKFTVPLPKEEEHKAVAVVQNAVNRVKEEQLQRRKRKFKLFKLTFC